MKTHAPGNARGGPQSALRQRFTLGFGTTPYFTWADVASCEFADRGKFDDPVVFLNPTKTKPVVVIVSQDCIFAFQIWIAQTLLVEMWWPKPKD